MTLQQYLQEDGFGGYASFLVHDLIPLNSDEVDLLLIFESPHIDELQSGIPLSGGAGRAAFQALMSNSSSRESLGPFVSARRAVGDARVGIMNVSRVPLQLAALKLHRSRVALTHYDWNTLERMRVDRAGRIDDIPDHNLQDTSRLLLPSVQLRISQIQFSRQAVIVPAGKFAQRYWNSLASQPHISALPVPHPSNGWWTRASAKQDVANLAELRRVFERHTS